MYIGRLTCQWKTFGLVNPTLIEMCACSELCKTIENYLECPFPYSIPKSPLLFQMFICRTYLLPSEQHESEAMSELAATALAGSPCHHVLKYRTSLATPLATAIAVADAAKCDTTLVLSCVQLHRKNKLYLYTVYVRQIVNVSWFGLFAWCGNQGLAPCVYSTYQRPNYRSYQGYRLFSFQSWFGHNGHFKKSQLCFRLHSPV